MRTYALVSAVSTLLFVLHVTLLTQRATAQSTTSFRPTQFQRLDFAPCFDNPAWIERETVVRASLVVHPDGAWVLVLDGAARDEAYVALAPALQACMEQLMIGLWGMPLSPAPRTSRVYVRDFGVQRESVATRRSRLREHFEGVRLEMARCLDGFSEDATRVRVRVHVHHDGRVEVTLPTRDANRSICISTLLGTFDPGPEVTLRETVEGGPAGRRVIVGEGEICAWGDHGEHVTPPNENRVCARGLRCCSGGARGSDSSCFRGSICPSLP